METFRPPNILHIVLDDIGFGAIDTFGGLIETPNITRLADNGLRYTNFHKGRAPMNKSAIAALLHPHGYRSFALGKGHNTSVEPWLYHLAFSVDYTPSHIWTSWIANYRGKFDMGWDRYREQVLKRQKKLGLVPRHTELSPMLEGVPPWNDVGPDEKELFARKMEIHAAFMSYADAQLGRLVDFLERTGQLDNTLIFVFTGEHGASGERSRSGPPGWAQAMNTPFKRTQSGSTRGQMVVHWPAGIQAKGECRTQFHHVIDIIPTILQAAGVEAPPFIEGVPMNYSFEHADAETTHPTQFFEMPGKRAIVDRGWKAVSYHGRMPWESEVAWSFEQDHWELYDLERDPSECHDLAAEKDAARSDDPIVKKLFQLVALWWEEASRSALLAKQRTVRASPEAVREAARGDER